MYTKSRGKQQHRNFLSRIIALFNFGHNIRINIQGHDVKTLSGRWFKSNGPLKIADFDVNISE